MENKKQNTILKAIAPAASWLYVFAFLITLSLISCVHNSSHKDVNDLIVDTVVQQKPNIDSLLKTIMRPSEMVLPMVWTDTIYDTCQTYYSTDKKFVAFIGETEEDAIRNSKYGIYGDCKETLFNSLFLHDIEGDTTMLVFTASPEIGALSNPQIDSKRNLLYFLRGDIYISKGFYRYDINSHETKYLTGSRDELTYTLKPNGNILFQDVSESVYIWDSTAFEDIEYAMTGFVGNVLCDIEMTPSGICVGKGNYHIYYYGAVDSIDYDMEATGILTNKTLRHKWIDSIGDTRYFNKKGECVGVLYNNVESYDGWNGLKQTEK